MTREEALEKELRRWCVGLWGDRHECRACGGKWPPWKNKRGVEQHARSCVLFREGFDVAPEPHPMPF